MTMKPEPPLEIYVHIPFCLRKCGYCDFLSFSDCGAKEAYLRALREEIRYAGKAAAGLYAVRSVFIGGGTPSILSESEIGTLAEALAQSFAVPKGAEWTLEANPATFDRRKALFWRSCGINRVSMGVQTFSDRLLRRIGRVHTAEQARKGFWTLREAGFTNVSMDLMMGLPEQSFGDWMQTLTEAVSLGAEHLSCYSLLLEEGTPFYEAEREGRLALPDEETERAMYHAALRFLREKGYEQYEISNFAIPGRRCLHNLGYWERVPYLGLGLGASSLLGNVRYRNQTDLAAYLREAPETHRIEEERLSRDDQMSEFMILGLRKTEGIRKDAFRTLFSREAEDVYGDGLRKLVSENLLREDAAGYRLTEYGLDLANFVFREFIS